MAEKHTSSSPTTYKMGELFCGPGGIALGAHNAADKVPGIKVKHAWANDYDPTTADTYRENTPGASEETVYVGDVRELDTDALPPIDGFAFGFPCNDFSLVGKQKGLDGTYGPLYSYGINVLKSHKPEWFVAENVGGLSGANEGLAFPYILREMQRAGYTVVAHKYRFEEYGLPQARHRIIIVGLRNDIAAKGAEFKVPAPTTLEPSKMRTSKQAITEPPIPEWATNNEPTRQSEVVKQRLAYIKPGENAFNATDMPEELRLNVRGAKLSQIYKRLDPNKPAYTVTGSGGGGTHIYHWEEPRALTNRERARLQTFPDWYKFIGSKENVRRQIGMAVPPDGAQVVFEALFKTLEGIPYESIEPNIDVEKRIQAMEDRLEADKEDTLF
ncbi:DNA cytosine methyltransferase [Rothia mucilaginosa]|uniref:Cytosine-specific methyltransferase n=1 Tax=Rothia mucilaginosa TaxID=43675 RepID=A0A291DHP5_9MICC|nr:MULTISPECIES: DNA cytosine methyltransferase [Rothia]ATF63910.1 DNA cytosine methyltransferase [Rothia mucilaginosa]OFM25433.1 DNA cytosine methyltransferase [Rothia sp. HMSC069D01]